MFFHLSKGAIQRMNGLQDLVDEQGILHIHDSQQARLVAQILSRAHQHPQQVKAWQVLAAAELKALFSDTLRKYLEGKEFFTQSNVYQKCIDKFRRPISPFLNESESSVEILTASLFHENPALSFLNPFWHDFPLLDERALQHLLAHPMLAADPSKNLLAILQAPVLAHPHDLLGQLEYIRKRWDLLNKTQSIELAMTMKFIYEEIEEEGKRQHPSTRVLRFKNHHQPGEASHEAAWKKNLVLIAKNANVWLVQLSRKYGRKIEHLDQIPEEELARFAGWGINSLWLIGVWERSPASRKIKELYGKTDTTASAYSIKEYRIAAHLGGEDAVDGLIARSEKYGIKLCVDMVPNHTGIDSDWILEHPEWYISVPNNPVDYFHFNSPDLSPIPQISIKLEEGYYKQTSAAEVFLYEDHRTGKKHYIYHGNDGTSMPWNDTAQLNYLDRQVREQVINTILSIVKKFPLIRFDAAMTLTKQHFQRLWYPLPDSHERCVHTREGSALPAEDFSQHMPREFWREVVDRVALENPDAVLMAEAFWLMEGYFINELGMHRVYNSAFMHLLRDEENENYQQILKNALESDPEILGKFVNFLNNPDERTASDQFGRGDKYFAVCTLLATMPGMPMLGHGQIEGFEERYGMDFLTPLWDEQENVELIRQHEKWFFPLLRMRACFSNASTFCLFEVLDEKERPQPHIYAYLNRHQDRFFLVVVNNSFRSIHAHFQHTVSTAAKPGNLKMRTLAELLPAPPAENALLQCQEVRSGHRWTFQYRELEKTGMVFNLKPYQHLVCELIWKEKQGDNVPISH